MKTITKQEYFGAVRYYSLSIESQKRGLLHAHILIGLVNHITTTEQVDQLVCAQVPDPAEVITLV